ncbi:hypothetical protein LF845_11690 [Deferribacterales bacterium Es71-Z0220]|jgi:hypothetical protein|uniref:hypothetical protein n=1 Tax=Deferrivibrio essentukiensis TaxID=2880922 RepID=UPI001F6015F8|nr:hypothetical protein [Deferrivibrio essentukiensis]MCB4205604.1 hypothetical protein [Deferrivibrio essentukiensis]
MRKILSDKKQLIEIGYSTLGILGAIGGFFTYYIINSIKIIKKYSLTKRYKSVSYGLKEMR